MESSRHDKIVITIAAYVIGFTTAFIAYGVGKVTLENASIDAQSSLKINSEIVKEISAEQTTLILDSAGLRISTPTGEQLLTANQAPLVASVIASTGTPGMYFSIIDAELSRDKKFAYFCEQLTAASATCDPYVYSVADKMLHRVQINDSQKKIVIDSHRSAWTEDGKLLLDGAISKTQRSPWVLITVQ